MLEAELRMCVGSAIWSGCQTIMPMMAKKYINIKLRSIVVSNRGQLLEIDWITIEAPFRCCICVR